MAVNDVEFGEVRGRLIAVEATLKDLKTEVKEGNATSDAILLKLSAAEGGWKVLAGVAAASAAIGGILAKIIPLGTILPKI